MKCHLKKAKKKIIYICWIKNSDWSPYIKACVCAKLLQSCPTLCDPMDCSPRGSFVHGIFQAIILQWVAMPCPRGSSQPRDWTRVLCLLHWQVGSLWLATPEKPILRLSMHIQKQRHYFANKGLSSQGYGFSSGHVWMWELDCEEGWAPKN